MKKIDETATSVLKNRGFSLIEMVVAVAIISILGGLFFIGSDAIRRKKTEQYAGELCGQIRLMQTVSMAKAGMWRLCLYEKDGEYYCIQEQKQKDTDVWEPQSQPVEMGISGAMTYRAVNSIGNGEENGLENERDAQGAGGVEMDTGAGTDNMDAGLLIRVWRFDRDTGACIEGAGTLEVSGTGKRKRITVYKESGYCEESDIP